MTNKVIYEDGNLTMKQSFMDRNEIILSFKDEDGSFEAYVPKHILKKAYHVLMISEL